MTRCPTANARNSSRLGVTAPRAGAGAVTVMETIVTTGGAPGTRAAPPAAPRPGEDGSVAATADDPGPSRAGTGTAQGDPAPRRRGRRPGGADTRAQLLAAARVEFAERGYD